MKENHWYKFLFGGGGYIFFILYSVSCPKWFGPQCLPLLCAGFRDRYLVLHDGHLDYKSISRLSQWFFLVFLASPLPFIYLFIYFFIMIFLFFYFHLQSAAVFATTTLAIITGLSFIPFFIFFPSVLPFFFSSYFFLFLLFTGHTTHEMSTCRAMQRTPRETVGT